MPKSLVGSTFGSTFRYLGFVLGSALPPDFSPDSALLMFANGKNTDGTHKTDLINGYDMVAVEGPCLTLAIGDSIEMIGHGTFTSNTGTATFSTYDGTDLTCDGAGTTFELKFSDGTIFPCSEGAGDDENNVIIHDTTGQHSGTITVADTPLAMWTDNTQDVYMDGMVRGYTLIDAPDDDGIYYPADPTTAQLNMFQFEVVGDSELTVEGDDYSAGIHTIAGLSGGTPLTVVYGGADDQVVFTGDTVTGSGLDWSIDIDSSKVIIATMSEVVTYSLDIDVTGDSTITIASTGYTSSGSPHTITGLTGATPMVVTYGGDDDQTAFTDGDWADVTGTDPNFSVDMDENKSFSITTSQEVFTLTLAVTGDSTVTIDTVDYTSAGSPYDITDLTGATTMAITYGGSDDLTGWSGTDSGDVTGSGETWSITMDEDKSISCDCSEASSTGITRGNASSAIATGTSVDVSTPSGVSDGDLLVATINSDSDGTFTHTGWTLVSQVDSAGSSTMAMVYKVASGEGATQTFGFSVSADLIGVVSAYEKGSGTWTLDDSSVEFGGSTVVIMPTVVSTDPGLLVIGSGCDDAGGVTTAPSGMTQVAKVDGPSAFLVSWDELVGAGSQDKTFELSQSQVGNIIIAVGII